MHARNSNCKYASSLLILRSISLNNCWWVAAGHDMKHKWLETWSLANWIREFFAPYMLYVPKILFFYNLFKIDDSNSQADVKWTESDFTKSERRTFSWDNHKMQVLTDCDWLRWSFDEQSKFHHRKQSIAYFWVLTRTLKLNTTSAGMTFIYWLIFLNPTGSRDKLSEIVE